MSFLTHYLDKHRLDKMSNKMKDNVRKLEDKLHEKSERSAGKKNFNDLLKEYGQEIADLVERVSNSLLDRPALSIGSIIGTFRFVQSIAVEVYQILEFMSDSVVNDSMSKEEQRAAKITFGKDLVYFIWMTVNPLKGHFGWLPFKKTIEKKIVIWLAGMALESTVDLFQVGSVSAVQSFSKFSDDPTGKIQIIKALPD